MTLYDGLMQVAPSPVVELNRAVAVAMADPSTGPAAALEIVDGLEGLDGSYLLPSVRGELLARLGRDAEAADEFDRAATMTDNEREREVLADKATRARAAKRPARPFARPPMQRRSVVHLDDHVGVAVSAELMQSRCRADDVVGVIAGHRIIVDRMAPVRGDDGGPWRQPRHLAVQHLAQNLRTSR